MKTTIDLNDATLIAAVHDDDALIAKFLGPQYRGRRFVRYRDIENLGLCDNRVSLKIWMRRGAFPSAVRISGPYGKSLRWLAVEVARLVAQRLRERDELQTKKKPSGSARNRSADPDSNGPLATGRSELGPCVLPKIAG
jgi:hypothetical protein